MDLICWMNNHLFGKHEESLFLTYTPEAFKPGTVDDGRLITRVVEISPTRTIWGGRVPCYGVYGVRLQAQQERVRE